MVEIIPSLLTSDPEELRRMIDEVNRARLASGEPRRIHIDIIDGKFADNRTINPKELGNIESGLKYGYHLMVKEPKNWIKSCVRGSADRIIGHIEIMNNQIEFVGKVKKVGADVGLAIDLATEVGKVDSAALNNLDVIIIMSVSAGFGGQKFSEKSLDKVRELNKIRARDNMAFRICVDGGISEENIGKLVKAGADEVSIGRRIFKGDLKENLDRLVKVAHK